MFKQNCPVSTRQVLAEPHFEKAPTAGGIRYASVTEIMIQGDTVSMQIGNKLEAHLRHITQTNARRLETNAPPASFYLVLKRSPTSKVRGGA